MYIKFDEPTKDHVGRPVIRFQNDSCERRGVLRKNRQRPWQYVTPFGDEDQVAEFTADELRAISRELDQLNGTKTKGSVLMGKRDIDESQTIVKHSCRKCSESCISLGDNYCPCCGVKLRWRENRL